MTVHIVTGCRWREFDVFAAQMRAVHVCLYVVKPLKKKFFFKNQFIRYCVKQAAFFSER